MKLTKKEQVAIRALMIVARNWPKSLKLFSWSGHLHVLKPGAGRSLGRAIVASIDNIPNDGGDPNCTEIAR